METITRPTCALTKRSFLVTFGWYVCRGKCTYLSKWMLWTTNYDSHSFNSNFNCICFQRINSVSRNTMDMISSSSTYILKFNYEIFTRFFHSIKEGKNSKTIKRLRLTSLVTFSYIVHTNTQTYTHVASIQA